MMKNEPLSPGSPQLDDRILMRAPEELTPSPNNSRTHSTKQLKKLEASIKAFGFTAPVLTDEDGMVLSGHGRLEAAMALKISKIPTRVIAGLTEAQKRAYIIADNKLAELSGWDKKALKNELEILTKEDFSVELTGFSTAEIDLMFDAPAEPEPGDPDDKLPEVLPDIISRSGDLWVLGDHKLFCGDALKEESYAALLGDEKVQMVITDPPYNVPISGHVCGNGEVQHKEFAMASGEMSQNEFTSFLRSSAAQMHAHMDDGTIAYSFMDWRHMVEIQAAYTPVFGPLRQLCIWAKDNGGMGTFYRSQHELVFIYKKGDTPHINNFELGQHGRYRTNIWNYPGVNTFKGKGHKLLALHPTVKPVSLIADAMRDCSHRKGIILDPFAGSGTILIAAERTGRCARAIELDPQYVDVGVMRWQQLTGKEAVLATTGQSWSQIHAERLNGGQS